jgi:hypothetical protein
MKETKKKPTYGPNDATSAVWSWLSVVVPYKKASNKKSDKKCMKGIKITYPTRGPTEMLLRLDSLEPGVERAGHVT